MLERNDQQRLVWIQDEQCLPTPTFKAEEYQRHVIYVGIAPLIMDCGLR